jgi:hypothetical protein
MDDIKNFSKYSSLEEYLFNEVNMNFLAKGFLDSEEFFCIVIWKSNRAKSKILKKLLIENQSLDDTVKDITTDISTSADNHGKLAILLNKWHFRLPMASAILTVLYPNEFTIYDYRVCEELDIQDFSGRKSVIDDYFNLFLPKVRGIRSGKSLRENDKYLWGKSFYKDLRKLLTKT